MVDVTPLVLRLWLFGGYHKVAVPGPVWEDMHAKTKVSVLER